MARNFVGASAQHLTVTSAPVTAMPLTIACWMKPTGTGSQYHVGISDNSANNKFALGLFQQKVIAQQYGGGTSPFAQASATFSTGVWSHACAVFASTTSRSAYFNGANKGSDATSATAPSGVNQTDLGVVPSGAFPFDGDLAEVGIWNVALDDFEVAALAAGVCPLLIRPTALVAYWPLIGNYSPEIDPKGRYELTVTGATASPHPPIIYTAVNQLTIHVPQPKTLIAMQGMVTTLTRSMVWGKALRAVQSQLANLATLRVKPLTLLATQAVKVSLAKVITKTLRAVQASLLSFIKDNALVYLTINGTQYGYGRSDPTTGVLYETLSITEILDGTPTTAQFTVFGFAPAQGADVTIALLDRRIFGGLVLASDQIYEGDPSNVFYHVRAIDYTPLLNRRKVWKRYVGSTATAIAQDLIATYAAGFTSANVAAGLPVIDDITFDGQDVTACLTDLARRIPKGTWYCDYFKDVHLSSGSELGSNPTDLTAANASALALSNVVVKRDLGQVVTRVFVEGKGSRIPAAVNVGETILPAEDVSMFSPSGGLAVLTGQRLSYTGVQAGGAGGLVGPGASPSSAPSAASAAGSGLGAGTYQYGYTDVTAAGESLPSPIGSVVTGHLTDPANAPTIAYNGPNSINYGAFRQIGETVGYKYSYSGASGSSDYSQETLPSPETTTTTTQCSDPNNPTLSSVIGVSLPYSTDARVKWIHIWSRASSVGSTYYITDVIANNSAGGTTTWQDIGGDHTSGQNPAGSNSATFQQVSLSGVAVGPSGVTSRKVYRTVVNGSQLKLLTTLGDNTTTTYADSTADGSLGANAPTSDTSGLTQPTGTVNAGSTSLLLAGAGAFSSTGGWARIGNGAQYIRYAGISGNRLTGIPAAGAGAIAASITYNTTCTAVPALKLASTSYPLPPWDGSGIVPTATTGGALANGKWYGYAISFVTASGETTATPMVNPWFTTGANNAIQLDGIPTSTHPDVTARKIYRTQAQTSSFDAFFGAKTLVATLSDDSTTSYLDTASDASIAGNASPPVSNTATYTVSALNPATQPGDNVTLLVQVDDAGAQSVLATLLQVALDVGYVGAVLKDNPVGYWRLGDAGGSTTAADATGNGRTGTVVGGVTLGQAGALGDGNTAALFDGVNGKVTTSASALQLTAGPGSIELWVKRVGSSSDAGLAGTGISGLQITWHVGANIYFYAGDGGSNISSGLSDTTSYHHIVGTWDGTTNANGMKLYVDGALVKQGAALTTVLTAAPFIIGQSSTYFNGDLDEVALYNYVLTSAQVANHYALRTSTQGVISDGIQEDVIRGGEISIAEALDRGTAHLGLRNSVEVGLTYTCRDPLTRSGRSVNVNLPAPTNISGTFKIQQVRLSLFQAANSTLYPQYDVQASPTRFSLDDLLRIARKAA